MNYGYIGLGNLGGHLAASLIRAGHQVTVYDRYDRAGGLLRVHQVTWQPDAPPDVRSQRSAPAPRRDRAPATPV